jgi:arsenite-transporting ATPase
VYAALFGSAARGDMRPDSDIDIFLVRPTGSQLEAWERASSAFADRVTRWTGNDARVLEMTQAEVQELVAIGLSSHHVGINVVLPAPTDDSDPLANASRLRKQAAIASMPAELRDLPLDQVELKATNMVGVNALATLFTTTEPRPTAATVALDNFTEAPLADLIDELATQDNGLVMCMGKGESAKPPSPRPSRSPSSAGATTCI